MGGFWKNLDILGGITAIDNRHNFVLACVAERFLAATMSSQRLSGRSGQEIWEVWVQLLDPGIHRLRILLTTFTISTLARPALMSFHEVRSSGPSNGKCIVVSCMLYDASLFTHSFQGWLESNFPNFRGCEEAF